MGTTVYTNVVLKLNSVEVVSFQAPTTQPAATTLTCQVTGGTIVMHLDKVARKMSGTFTASASGYVYFTNLGLIQNGVTYNAHMYAVNAMTIVGSQIGGPAVAAGTSITVNLETFPASFNFDQPFTLYEAPTAQVKTCS